LLAGASERLTLSAQAADGTTTTRVIVPDDAAEYRFREPDTALLESVAALTGGRVSPAAGQLRDVPAAATASRRALWPTLVLVALAAWLCDILLRRIRLFDGAPRIS
jgi:hypothetical protein